MKVAKNIFAVIGVLSTIGLGLIAILAALAVNDDDFKNVDLSEGLE